MEVYHTSLFWHAFALSRPMRHFDRILDAQIRSRDEARRWLGRVWTRPGYCDRLPGGWDPSQTGCRSSRRAPIPCRRPLASVTRAGQRSWVSVSAHKGQRSCNRSSPDMDGGELPSPVAHQDDSSAPGKSLAGRLLGKAIKLFIKAQLESCGGLAVSVGGANSELLAGQVRELQISARDVVYKGIAITEVYLSASSIRLNFGWQDAGRLLSEPFAIVAAAQMNQTDLNASLASPTLSSVVSDLLGHQGSHPSNTVSMKTPPKSNNSSSPPANKISRSEKEAPTMPTVASTMAKGTGNVSDSSHTLVASAPSSMPFRATLADGTVVLRPFSGSPPIRTQSSRCGDTNNLRRSHAICGGAQAQAQGQEGVAAAAFASQPAAAVLSFHVGNDGQQLSVKVEPFEEGPPAALHPPPTAHRSLVAASEVHNLESVGRRQSETACIPHLQEKRVNRKERHFSLGPWSRINELTVTSEGIRLLGDFIVMPTPLEH